MSRPVYLIIYHSPIFAAHWALWIPSYDKDVIGHTGKIINVQGSPSAGFIHEFERIFDLSLESRSHSLKLLSWVNSDSIVDTACGYSVDSNPINILERAALDIQAPGPSLRRTGEPGPRTRVALRNCQTWLRELVAVLVHNHIFAENALIEIDRAPKN